MNLRKWNLRIVVGLSAFGLLAVAWAAQPETVTIEKCGTKKASVEFDHAAHVAKESECSTCHHTQEDLTADSDTADNCRNCHFEPTEEGVPSCSEMSPAKNPYHKTCIGCHKAAVKADEASTAPTKCDNCHPKA